MKSTAARMEVERHEDNAIRPVTSHAGEGTEEDVSIPSDEARSPNRKLVYLSGAPRVATHAAAESGGARAHVLGVINGFRACGWDVEQFIVGDHVTRGWTADGVQKKIADSRIRRLTADCVRIALGLRNRRMAARRMVSHADWAYERFAAFQALGRGFKKAGVPWIIETQSPLFYEAKNVRKSIMFTRLARRMEVEAYRCCDALICISEVLRDILVQEARLNPDKVIVVPNGVDTDVFDPAIHPARRQFHDLTIGFVGSVIGWQGLDSLFEAMAELRRDGVSISATIVGDGLKRIEWQAHAERLGLLDRVAFIGRVPWNEVPGYIAGFDLGFSGQVPLTNGRMYHSPLKLYEYMAMGKPVIASAFEDARRVVRDGRTGYLFEPGNKDALKRALTCAYRARDSLPEMGEHARAEILKHHGWKVRVERIIAEVERVLSTA